ncbi:hypothetical protein [Paenibacillus lactis]|uniref:hypothetical protein n=1 Tax=Paenibacillus lactis TaxID=228574 RepID=UPI001AFF8635|nr:hypothetical protein [Paenibacillus lactis]GIO93545.1 hypothetical protein J31TS3_47720 [Paenibacillus lactis]
MINVNQTLTGKDSFTMVEDIVLRMYTLLDGFTIETAGLYAYLRSWRQNDPSHKLYRCVWLSREEIYAQTGIGRKPFDRHLKALTACGLVKTEKGRLREPNKQVFVVNEPLTEAEFRALYPEQIARFDAALQEYYGRRVADQARFEEKRKAKYEISEVSINPQPDPEQPTEEAEMIEEVIAWF